MALKKKSKRYEECLKIRPEGKLALLDAVKAVKAFKATKFDPTIELVMHLGIDPKQPEQLLRGAISLPHGVGASRKVIAFCDGDNVEKAKAAGAIEAGADELVKKVQDGWTDFDVALATPNLMKIVSRLGRVLGPAGKMPSPKSGTVVDDVETAVREYAAGKVEFRNDDGGNIQVVVGKASFDEKKLVENVEAFINHIRRIKPVSTKGLYIKKACLSATMSPSVLLDVA
jgi:large subunit ribosomal protein L1